MSSDEAENSSNETGVNSDDAEDDEAGWKETDSFKQEKKVAGRKKRVLTGYKISFILFGLSSVLTVVIPTLKKGPSLLPIALTYAGGPFLASGLAYILMGAAENDRLTSDTYKRLNLVFAKYGCAWLTAAAMVFLGGGVAGSSRGAKVLCHPVMLLAALSTLVNGIKGWGYGVKGGFQKDSDNTYIDDLKKIPKSAIEQFTTPPSNIAAAGFLQAAYLAGTLKVVKLAEIARLLWQCLLRGESLTKISTRMLAAGRLAMLCVISLSLRDAADRDRLTGTTFIQLSFMTSLSFGAMAAYSAKMASKASSLAIYAGLLSIFSAAIGATSMYSKRSQKSS